MGLYVRIRVPPSLRKRGATTKRSRTVDPHLAVGKSAKYEQLLANRNQVPVSIRKVPGEGWQPEPGRKEASPAVGCPPRRLIRARLQAWSSSSWLHSVNYQSTYLSKKISRNCLFLFFLNITEASKSNTSFRRWKHRKWKGEKQN